MRWIILCILILASGMAAGHLACECVDPVTGELEYQNAFVVNGTQKLRIPYEYCSQNAHDVMGGWSLLTHVEKPAEEDAPKDLKEVTSDGIVRHYRRDGVVYLLATEELLSGHIVRYRYSMDDKSTLFYGNLPERYRIKEIKTTNRDGSTVFASARFEWESKDGNGLQLRIKCSDGEQHSLKWERLKDIDPSFYRDVGKKNILLLRKIGELDCEYYMTEPTLHPRLLRLHEDNASSFKAYYDGMGRVIKLMNGRNTAFTLNYEGGVTTVRNDKKETTTYRCTNHHLTKIEQFNADGSMKKSTEHWFEDDQLAMRQVITPKWNRYYYYRDGVVTKEVMQNNNRETVIDRNYTKTAPYLLLEETDNHGKVTKYSYDSESRQLVRKAEWKNNTPIFDIAYRYNYDGIKVKEIYDKQTKRIIRTYKLEKEKPYIGMVRSIKEDHGDGNVCEKHIHREESNIQREIYEKSLSWLTKTPADKSVLHSVDRQSPHPKYEFCFLNGIVTNPEEAHTYARELYGAFNCDYKVCYHATNGLLGDGVRYVGGRLGYRNKTAELLRKDILDTIDDGKDYIVTGFSDGVTTIYNAIKRLDRHTRKHLHVFAISPGKVIPVEFAKTVVNYIPSRDPLAATYPVKYVKGRFFTSSSIKVIDSQNGKLFDHKSNNETSNYIRELIRKKIRKITS